MKEVDRLNNIEVFRETLDRIKHNAALLRLTQGAVAQTAIIDAGFVSNKAPAVPMCRISFEEGLTLIPAYRFADAGKKTAVLNFANPVEPGGGVLRGANAQEEYLCRASNLYLCLTGASAEPYYRVHNRMQKELPWSGAFLATDRIVYSPGVTFFREDVGYVPDDEARRPVQTYTDVWRTVDVITCAAPYFVSRQAVLPQDQLYGLFVSRIRNILEAAMEHEIEALVLGAFGCGAFHNPPAVVAKAFQDVLKQARFLHAFSDVVFAVKRSGRFCENIEVFERAFQRPLPAGASAFGPEENKRGFFA